MGAGRMSGREVRIVFEVDDCDLSEDQLWDLAEQFVTYGPEIDPPVLTFDRIEVTEGKR
jgi:hypothetical protein